MSDPAAPTTSAATEDPAALQDVPPHRYTAGLAQQIELQWQQRWATEGTLQAPNPVGDLSKGFESVADRPKLFVLDMFPYPSGTGLHVGHPLGFIATDVYARYRRMTGYNVLHTMGFDSFGLPAEQYAVQTGQHPRVATEANIANMRRQLRRLGLGHDDRRSVSTTDVEFYRWTQWIFLQLFNAWFDPETQRARPITELVDELDRGKRNLEVEGRPWAELDTEARSRALLDFRLAYVAEAMVNWCPALGTVLANEEVTNEGRSDRGNYPVFRRPLRQWMLRITAYADRLLADLETLDWPKPVEAMQRNWIGRSTGAEIAFAVEGGPSIEVFTTRPDTLFGATYLVVAPEHELLDDLVAEAWPDDTPGAWRGPKQSANPSIAVGEYRAAATEKSERERQADDRQKSGVFTGMHATNPVNGERVPIFVADYVLVGYGTGAIMAVPAHDQRDLEFAQRFGLPVTAVIQPPESWYSSLDITAETPVKQWPEAYIGAGTAIESASADITLDGLDVEEAKARITEWLQQQGSGRPTTTYRLRDWLFSRQRYWGEPFPIVWDGDVPIAVPEAMLPVELPEVDDYAPVVSESNDESVPEPPLGRATEWREVTLDLGDGPRAYRRELNTMPQWAGSCWYYLRYLDPTNDDVLVDPQIEQYWMNVDLYIGGVEHAVLHLLYARFWHKVLFDLGHVSTPEPFQRLYNQGYITADAFIDERGIYVEAREVDDVDGQPTHNGRVVKRVAGKMGKSLKNSVTPDEMYEQYGADSLRLYEMAMGPLDSGRPWSEQGVVGLYRFLQRMWRALVDEDTGELLPLAGPDAAGPGTRRLLHRTIAGVTGDLAALRLNTAVAKLIELVNHLTKQGSVDRETAETLVLLLAPLAPHVAEELWSKLGHVESLAWHAMPEADPSLLVDDHVEVPVQVQGKVRGKVTVAAGADESTLREAALAEPNVARHLEGRTVVKVVVVPGRLVNIVVS